MNVIEFFPELFAALLLFFTVISTTTFRLPSLLRAYAYASISLGGLTAIIGYIQDTQQMFYLAVLIILVKGLLVPMAISSTVKQSGALLRLPASVRPATSWFLAAGVITAAVTLTTFSPFVSADAAFDFLLPISVSIVFLGLIMMIARHDVLSQMIGFLVMENGIAAFSLSTLGELSTAIEFGFYSVVLIGAVLMATLSHRVQELYGSQDSSGLNELID